jgi:hypothetical protein
MADNKLLQQMLEHLVNDDQAKAEELFHEYVVTKSREIYESMIDSEIAEEDEKEDDDEENKKVDEASDEDDDEENKKVDEEFEDIAIEGDDEMDLDSDDPMDKLAGEIGPEEEEGEGEEGEKSEEELFQDLDAIVDELQAKFDELKGGEEGEMDMGSDGEMKDDFDLETVREYVEKVPAGHGAEKKGAAEKADNVKSTIDNMKNDMGGTTANILSGRNGATGSETGALKGNGLLKGAPKEDNAGNINVPGGKAGNAFSKKEPGHGAEKAGAKESADNKQSLFRGRR